MDAQVSENRAAPRLCTFCEKPLSKHTSPDATRHKACSDKIAQRRSRDRRDAAQRQAYAKRFCGVVTTRISEDEMSKRREYADPNPPPEAYIQARAEMVRAILCGPACDRLDAYRVSPRKSGWGR
jgi:hypothetical protein